MQIVLLAAGLSSRMGKTNKMLIPFNGMSLVCNCCMKALKTLEKLNEKSRLVVVTGYRSLSVEKTLKECKAFIETTHASIEMIIVKNRDYRNGQFSSVKTGLRETEDGKPFFIALGDMPLINEENYTSLIPLLEKHDAVRPFCNGQPGHPVLFSSSMKETILSYPDSFSVNAILKSHDVIETETHSNSTVLDIDTPQDLYLTHAQEN